MSRPLVSVCIPTRDRAVWLGEALKSVHRQTQQDLEIVVYDDASTDSTRTVLARWASPRLRSFRHEMPVGVAANRNACLEKARGRFIAWLDSDDRYHPRMLEVQTAALLRHPNAVLAHGGFQVIDGDGRPLPDWPKPFSDDCVESGKEAFAHLVTRNYVTAPTVLVRRSAHDEAGPYRGTLPTGEDWEMWLRLALVGDFVYTARPLAQYRWHRASLARTAAATGRQLQRDLEILDGVFDAHPDLPEAERLQRRGRAALAARALRRATDCLTRGERRGAIAAIAVAVRARPEPLSGWVGWKLLLSAGRLDEYEWHLASRRALDRLAGELEGSRVGSGLRQQAVPDPAWEETLREIAAIVRRVVPADAPIAVVDKWDPTVLHLARREGRHFPDRRILPDGYPRDGEVAVTHLEAMERGGTEFLVLPSSGFWWLEHYPELADHLAATADRVWNDGRCRIYRLRQRARRMGVA